MSPRTRAIKPRHSRGRSEGREAGLKNTQAGATRRARPFHDFRWRRAVPARVRARARGRRPLVFALAIVDWAVDTMQLTVKALQGRECNLQVKSPRRLLHSLLLLGPEGGWRGGGRPGELTSGGGARASPSREFGLSPCLSTSAGSGGGGRASVYTEAPGLG